MNLKFQILLILITILCANSLTVTGQETVENASIAFCHSDERYSFERLDVMTIDSRMYVEIAASPDGNLLAVAILSRVLLYDAHNFQLLYTLRENNLETWHNVSLAWSPDSSYLAVGTYITVAEIPSPENQIQIWDMTSQELVASIRDVEVQQIVWSSANQLLTLLGPVGEITVWNSQTGELVAEHDAYETHAMLLSQIAWALDGNNLIGLGEGSFINWHLASNEVSFTRGWL